MQAAVTDPDELAAVISDFEKLSEQVAKLEADRNPKLMTRAWSAITSVLGTLAKVPALVTLGKMLGLPIPV